jgi:hypothetical protein
MHDMNNGLLEDIIKRVEDVIKKRFETDEIKRVLEHVIEKRPKNVIEGFLERIGFGKRSCNHPLVGKAINWGTFSRKVKASEPYNKLNRRLIEILKRGLKVEDIAEDIAEVSELLNDLRGQLIDYIITEEICGAEGLRHIHAPGSAAKREGRNFYLPGERYTSDTLCRLASRLFDSIALGDALGIYSESENLMLGLRQLAEHEQKHEQKFGSQKSKSQKFGAKFRIEPKDLGINENEAIRPYAALLGLILWLMKKLMVKEELELKSLIQSILNELRVAPICIFFMPSERGGRGRERWSTIYLPRLDIFFDRWIFDEKARKEIEDLRDGLKKFIVAAYRVAEREKRTGEVENAIDVLMDNYDALCRSLMEHGNLDLYATRRMMDIMVDLAIKYGLHMYLRPLGSILRHGHSM